MAVAIKQCRYGPLMYLPNDTSIGRTIDLYAEVGYHEVEYYKQLLSLGDVVVDAGAHIGTVAVPLAQTVGSTGKVFAVEAYTYISYILSANIVLNNLHNVRVINAVAANNSTVLYFQYEELFERVANDFAGMQLSPDTTSLPVPSIAIDDMSLERLNFLKIDVEGMEPDVLQGAKKTIERCRPWLSIEINWHVREIVEFLSSLPDYDCRMFQPPWFNKDNFAGNTEDAWPGLVSKNLICFPQERSVPESPWFVKLRDSSHE